MKDGKNDTTYRKDWKMCMFFFHKLDFFFFFFFLFRERDLGKDEKGKSAHDSLLDPRAVKVLELES